MVSTIIGCLVKLDNKYLNLIHVTWAYDTIISRYDMHPIHLVQDTNPSQLVSHHPLVTQYTKGFIKV